LQFRSLVAVAAAAVISNAAGLPARAAVIVVETNADNVTGPLCDIRDAIAAANDDTPVGGCDVGGSGADTIDLTGLDQPIELSLGVLPTIRGDVTITGPGAAALTIDGLDTSQIFVIERGNVWIENLTLAGGMVAEPGRGGCLQILPDASVTLSAVRVTGCAAWGGGGIAIDEGSLNLAGSLVDANTTSGGAGAGILNGNGDLWVTTTTLSGNVANGETSTGGGIASIPPSGKLGGATRLYSSTIADNGASSGGNLFTAADMTTTLTNTLLAAAKAGGNCAGALTSAGYNLSTDASCAIAAAGDLSNTPAGLDVLADNGGPTVVHALLAGSAAIDAGNPAGCFNAIGAQIPFDQRGPGFPRRTDGDLDGFVQCDIGAFETAPEPLASALGITAAAALAQLARRRAGSRIG